MKVDKQDAPVKRPGLREQQKAASHERLLDAAVEVFEQVGFRNTTVDQIAQAAGASRATFYLHFKDKTAVASALARRWTPVTKRLFSDLNRLENPTAVQLESWVEDYLQSTKVSPLMNQMFNEALAWGEAFVTDYQLLLDYIADRVMRETFARIPAQRRPLVRTKFILILFMLDRYRNVAGQEHGDYLAQHARSAIAELLLRDLFSEQHS